MRIDTQNARAESLEDANEQMKDDLGDLESTIASSERMDLFIENLMIDAAKYMAKKLESPRLTIGHSTTNLCRFASNISDKQLKQCDIDTKYKPFLNRMEKVSHQYFS